MKLADRTRQMEQAIRRADTAEKATKETIERAEKNTKEAIEQAQKATKAAIERAEAAIKWAEETKRRAIEDAEAILREARILKKQAEEIRMRVGEKIQTHHPDLHKIVPGENSIRDKYLESFTIDNGIVHVKLRNTSDSRIKPNFTILFFDEGAFQLDRADISWVFTSIEPGETSSDEIRLNPNFAQPAYYTLSFRDPETNVAAGERQPVGTFLAIGDQAMVQGKGNIPVFLATSDSAWYEMLDAVSANSAELVARLIRQGKVIAPKGGTMCVIVKVGLLSKLVRIKEGPLAGQEGWVDSEFVKPFKRN